MSQLCDIAIHVNSQETFFLNEKVLSSYSGKLKKIIKEKKRKTQIKNSGLELDEFPGGPEGFELVSRFCYNNGRVDITASNVCLLYCCAAFLGMTERVMSSNLLEQSESFLEGMFYWSWGDTVASLKSCERFFGYADSVGLIEKLIYALLAKIEQNDDHFVTCSSSSSLSPDTISTTTGLRMTPESTKPGITSAKQWWFDDLSILPPMIVEKIMKNMGAYGNDNNSLIFTRFILHYLKNTAGRCSLYPKSDYSSLADTAIHGVIFIGKTSFSCRGLFFILRIVSGFCPSRNCRAKLERLIGAMLDQAMLDDLLVSGHDRGGVYDVNLVLRLMRVFVNSDRGSAQKLKKVGRLIDMYLCEISPDHNLKISKFLEVAESLPEFARDCFDGVYRAIDIFLESHSSLSFEERSRLCGCLNYEKLSLEACKDLAKNPRIPPNIAIKALMSQQSKVATTTDQEGLTSRTCDQNPIKNNQTVLYDSSIVSEKGLVEENHDMRLNILRMHQRVVELEKVCREMKGQMSRLARNAVVGNSYHGRALPRLC